MQRKTKGTMESSWVVQVQRRCAGSEEERGSIVLYRKQTEECNWKLLESLHSQTIANVEDRVERLQEHRDQKVSGAIISPSHFRSYTHKVSPTWLPKQEGNKDTVNEHVKVERKIPRGLNHTWRTTGNWVKLGTREVVLPGEEHADWLPSTKQSVLKSYI